MRIRARGAHRRAGNRGPASRVGAAASAVFLVAGLVSATTGPAEAAVGVPVTYLGPTYDASVNRPSENKPQSKLWHTDGSWWGLLVSNTDNRVHIFQLLPNHTWSDTGVQVDNRLNSTGDAHWDEAGKELTVASRMDGTNLAVNQFSYNTTSKVWSPVNGFPVTVNTGGGSESAAIDKDSTGRFWVTYTRASRVWVAHSDQNGLNWTAGFAPSVPDVSISSDDISSVMAFAGQIGVMWSDQNSHAMRFAIHTDGAADNQWRVEDALAGMNQADDHINLKTAMDNQGKVYAAVKTGQDATASAALVGVLIRSGGAGAGTWQFVEAGKTSDDHTRPIIQIDKTNQELYFFATAPVSGGDIFYKKTSLANPTFANQPGRGQKFVDAAPLVNNPAGSKQPVTAETGMVVLAVAEGQKKYAHAEMELAGGGGEPPPGDTSPPTAPTNLDATVSGSAVDLTWTASSDNVAVTGYQVIRNGGVVANVPGTATSHRDSTVATGQTYTYTVKARDAASNWSDPSNPDTVTVPGDPPPSGGDVTFRAVTTATSDKVNTLTVPSPASLAGDVLLASIDWRGQTTVTPPAGWSLVGSVIANGTAARKATYTRVATGSEPPSHAWRFAAKPTAVGSIAAYSGVSTTAPVEATGSQVAATGKSITAPSVSASEGSGVIGLFSLARAGSVTPPTGMTERSEVTRPAPAAYPITAETADRAQGTAGATGSLVATTSVSGPNIGQVVVLRGAS